MVSAPDREEQFGGGARISSGWLDSVSLRVVINFNRRINIDNPDTTG
jgi:hypothetical protein